MTLRQLTIQQLTEAISLLQRLESKAPLTNEANSEVRTKLEEAAGNIHYLLGSASLGEETLQTPANERAKR